MAYFAEDLGRSAVSHPTVSVRYRDESRDNRMGVAVAHAVLDRHLCDSTDPFQIPSLAE